MSDHPRKALKEVTRMLAQHGISIVSDERTTRHRKLRVEQDGKTATIIVSISPSDHRAYYNIVKSARQMLREAP